MKFFRESNNTNDYFAKDVEVKSSPIHGLGVFATADIPIHTCFEICPVICFNQSLFDAHFRLYEVEHILTHYIFRWIDSGAAIALGYGSLYNHSIYPNAFFNIRKEKENPGIKFIAKKNILAGEEILIKYHPDSSILEFKDENYYESLMKLELE